MTIKRKTLRFKNFYDLKKQAYKIALKSRGQKDGSQWIKNHINMYYPSSNTRHFEKVIEVYRKYFDNEITLNQAKQIIENIEDEFDGTMNMLQNIFKFQSVMNKAFEVKRLKYGEVEFECPICKGKAFGAKYYTPENIAHEVIVRAYCQGCGYRMIN